MKARLKAKKIKVFFTKWSRQKKPEEPNTDLGNHGGGEVAPRALPSEAVTKLSPEDIQPDRSTARMGGTTGRNAVSNNGPVNAITASHSDKACDITGGEASDAQSASRHGGSIATTFLTDTVIVSELLQDQPQQPQMNTTVARDATTSAAKTDAMNMATFASHSNNTESKYKVCDTALEIADKHTMGGFFTGAHHMSLNNLLMVDNSTTNIQGAGDKVIKSKKLLSKYMIPGAAHDSSARDPPPKCHPGTRIKINEHIIAWFYDKTKRELVLWIHGLAGVGKSAIVQTFAEVLSSAKCLGASVFFSRPNGRNNSHGVFITVAYQLAVHIEPYGAFISEKLTVDPELVTKSMEEQFKAFIIEPFVEKKIGAGGKTWGILLDGLDELDHHHQHQKIIRLITTFAHNHPGIPLAWVIASRPEPHIVNTFKQQTKPSYLDKDVPMDSPESCQDVERFLRSSFDTISQDFSHIVPEGWPEEREIVRVAHAASGLFAFANVVVQFIGDPEYANPVNRLKEVLAVTYDRSHVDNQPFAHLDALYTHILTRIPSKMWPTTRRVLSAMLWLPDKVKSVRGISVIIGVGLDNLYPAVNYLHSVLRIPLPSDATCAVFSIHHHSFKEFLQDVTRSKQFHVSLKDADGDFECSLRIWQDFKRQHSGGPRYRDNWLKFASQFYTDDFCNPRREKDLTIALFHYIHEALLKMLWKRWRAIKREASPRNWDLFLDLLCQVDAATASRGFRDIRADFVRLLFDAWEEHQEELTNRGVVYEIPLEQLRLDHLQWPKEYPSDDNFDLCAVGIMIPLWEIDQVHNLESFNFYMRDLKYLQQTYPKIRVLMVKSQRDHFAVFSHLVTKDEVKQMLFYMYDPIEWYGCIPFTDQE